MDGGGGGARLVVLGVGGKIVVSGVVSPTQVVKGYGSIPYSTVVAVQPIRTVPGPEEAGLVSV